MDQMKFEEKLLLFAPNLNMKLGGPECTVGLFHHHNVICAVCEALSFLRFGRGRHVKAHGSIGLKLV